MRFFNTFTLLIVVVCGALTVAAQTKPPARRMAVTIDDLPWVGSSDLANARRQTKKLLSVLRTHRVPTVGFVNEGKLQVPGQVEARTALLQDWVNAGMILGNHTYSHADFNALTVEQFAADILKGESVTRRLMRPRLPYQLYFRSPMTRTGNTQDKKEALEKFLAKHGYKMTPHTIENSDFIFNAVYVRARQRGDEATARRLRESYLDFTIAASEFAERISPQIFGREVTQTLLIHANDITADCLDEMLRRFKTRGYRFVTLDAAMADPAYATKDTLVSSYGPTWLWRWMKSMGKDLTFDGDPEPPEWVMTSYRQTLSAQ
ncbi:MAG TPA: polysaccharide deacetylase family protein [Pyrinomonadaceae bacterium]